MISKFGLHGQYFVPRFWKKLTNGAHRSGSIQWWSQCDLQPRDGDKSCYWGKIGRTSTRLDHSYQSVAFLMCWQCIHQHQSSRTGGLHCPTFCRILVPNTDRKRWFSTDDFFELRKYINILSKVSKRYQFSPRDLTLVFAEVELYFWLRYPY